MSTSVPALSVASQIKRPKLVERVMELLSQDDDADERGDLSEDDGGEDSDDELFPLDDDDERLCRELAGRLKAKIDAAEDDEDDSDEDSDDDITRQIQSGLDQADQQRADSLGGLTVRHAAAAATPATDALNSEEAAQARGAAILAAQREAKNE